MDLTLLAQIGGIISCIVSAATYMKLRKKTVAVTFATIGVGCIVLSFVGRGGGSGQTATTHGNNSPAFNAVSTGGNATINQAGRDIVINQGVTREQVNELLKQRTITFSKELAAKYPAGWVMFGIANGKTVWNGSMSPIKVESNWDETTLSINPDGVSAVINLPRMVISYGSNTGNMYSRSSEEFRFVEGVSERSMYSRVMYYEVIDAKEKIFVVGFK